MEIENIVELTVNETLSKIGYLSKELKEALDKIEDLEAQLEEQKYTNLEAQLIKTFKYHPYKIDDIDKKSDLEIGNSYFDYDNYGFREFYNHCIKINGNTEKCIAVLGKAIRENEKMKEGE